MPGFLDNLFASGALGQLGAGLLSAPGAAGVAAGFGNANNALQAFQQQQVLKQQQAAQTAAFQQAAPSLGFSPEVTSVLAGMPPEQRQKILAERLKFNKDRELFGAIGDPSNPLNAVSRVQLGLDADAGEQLTAETSRRGQDVTARGQDITAGTAANRLSFDQEKKLTDDERNARIDRLNQAKFLLEERKANATSETDRRRIELRQAELDELIRQFDQRDATTQRGQDLTAQAAQSRLNQPTDILRNLEAANIDPASPEGQRAILGSGRATPESDREIARLESVGYTREEAIKLKEGVIRVVTDPVTRETQIVDLSTGQIVTAGGGQPTPQQVAPQGSQAVIPDGQQSLPDPNSVFGVGGTLRSAANTVSDVFGAGAQFPDVQNSQSDFAVLKERLINDIATSYGKQPPAFLLKNIENLTPSAGSLTQGADGARSDLRALKRSFENELATQKRRTQRRLTPTKKGEVDAQIDSLEASIGRIDGALQIFEGGAGATTTNGVQWRVK